MSPLELIKLARATRKNAYAPYSNFFVGCALSDGNGQTATGCNIENAAFGSTICAEANALSSAVAAGLGKPKQIAIVSTTQATPCGNCRQLISELAPNAEIYLALPEGDQFNTYTINSLLPDAFNSLD